MTAFLPIEKARPLAAPGWPTHLAGLGLVWAALLLLFRHDVADVAALWVKGNTYNHCLLILPLIGWLVWQRRPELARLAPAAWAPGLLPVAAGAFGWLLGEAGGIDIARHLALVLMLQGAAIACLGKAAARGLAFPIFYALFLVPFGEELVPPMQTVTAKMAMALLALSHVPATIRGVFISTPAGYFEVAEACSGVKFLIAMAAYAALAANVCFRSNRRRAAFVVAALVFPVLANGVRAWGTIWVAYLTDKRYAVGFDHVVYGWIFFALVIVVVMAAARPFFDRGVDDPWFDPAALQPEGTPPGPAARLALVGAAALALAAAAPAWSAAVQAGSSVPVADVALPQVPGWSRVPRAGARDWVPNFSGYDAFRIGRYRDAAGREVDLAIAVYARQEDGRELAGFGQGATRPDGAWAWTADAPAPPGGKSERIFSHGVIREVASFYRVGAIVTGSRAAVKLETMRTHLLGGPQRAVAILVSAEEKGGAGSARPALDAFLRSLGPIERVADRAAGLAEAR
ncbi:MAG: exosortase A [Allosphingosinicella sp.]